jgi:putative transposase
MRYGSNFHLQTLLAFIGWLIAHPWPIASPHTKKRPGSIPSFNSKLRDECLNEHVFLNLAEARQTIEAWRYDYNHLRPHGSLGALTPDEFAMLKGQETQPPQEGETSHGLYL